MPREYSRDVVALKDGRVIHLSHGHGRFPKVDHLHRGEQLNVEGETKYVPGGGKGWRGGRGWMGGRFGEEEGGNHVLHGRSPLGEVESGVDCMCDTLARHHKHHHIRKHGISEYIDHSLRKSINTSNNISQHMNTGTTTTTTTTIHKNYPYDPPGAFLPLPPPPPPSPPPPSPLPPCPCPRGSERPSSSASEGTCSAAPSGGKPHRRCS